MAERAVRDERRMTDLEALMWNLDKDPYLTSSFANVTVLDQLPDEDRLRARLLTASQVATRLARRVVPALGRLAPPTWEPDPNFDIDYHLQATALAGPATLRQLLDFAARVHQAPFERTRPLWRFVIVGGLEGGRAAMIQKMHHTITDGVGGLRLAESFIDLEREPASDDPPTPPPQSDPEPAGPWAEGQVVARVVDTASHLLGRTASNAAGAAQAATEAVRHPSRIVDLGRDAVGTVSSVTRELRGGAGSPLWRPRTLQRRIEALRVPLDEAKVTARAHGVTVNDVFVTAAARGAGSYHDAEGDPVDELRMAMPVSTRTDSTASGNAFSLTRCDVPVAIDDPIAQLQAIHARLAAVRSEPAFRVLEQLAAVANAMPTSALVAGARRQTEMVDFTTSNLRGAPFPLYLAGARIEANYPVGPLAGTAFNLTCISADGMLDMGLHVDSGAVERPGGLRQAIEGAFDEILSA